MKISSGADAVGCPHMEILSTFVTVEPSVVPYYMQLYLRNVATINTNPMPYIRRTLAFRGEPASPKGQVQAADIL